MCLKKFWMEPFDAARRVLEAVSLATKNLTSTQQDALWNDVIKHLSASYPELACHFGVSRRLPEFLNELIVAESPVFQHPASAEAMCAKSPQFHGLGTNDDIETTMILYDSDKV
jgi:hypothetical protein